MNSVAFIYCCQVVLLSVHTLTNSEEGVGQVKVALYPLLIIFTSVRWFYYKNGGHWACFELKTLKKKLKVSQTGATVAMVTSCINTLFTKDCSTIVARSYDKE